MPKREKTPEEDTSKPFNPLAKSQLARSVADALLSAEMRPLPPSERFSGAGVYAIYYDGASPSYSPLLDYNKTLETPAPIYVGKAIPSGGRKGGMDFETTSGYSLFKRLSEHADSITKAPNLEISDFRCRYLVVDDIWIPLAENLLIKRFRPLWNHLIDGFGNHTPGSGRYEQKKSRWDALHPGRHWVERLQPSTKSKEEIELEIQAFFLATRDQ